MKYLTLKQVGVALLCLVMASTHGGSQPRKGDSRRGGWIKFTDPQLGIAFEYPPQWHVWRNGRDIYLDVNPKILDVKPETSDGNAPADERRKVAPTYRQAPQVDRAFNGRLLAEQGNYGLHLTVGQGDFAQGNAEHQIFEVGEDKMPRVAFGRFRNEPARKRAWGEWHGLDSMILCSTWDEATGFHSAGGLCYWALISNKRQYVLIESPVLENERTERLIRRIAASIKSVKLAL